MLNHLFESCIDKLNIPSDMKSAVKEIHSICLESEGQPALLEDAAGSAQKKARNVIRAIVSKRWPAMASRLDDIVVGENGQPILTAGGNTQTYIQSFEHRVRSEFFGRDSGANIKFEPGAARIAFNDLNLENRNENARGISTLAKIIKIISEAHADEYNLDLNGLSYEDLETRFGARIDELDEEEKTALANDVYEKSDYVIEEIPNHEAAKKYYQYTNPNSRWCITHMPHQWAGYTHDGINKVYFAHKPGFENMEPVKGEGCPLDEYGLSLISIIVDPWSNLRAVTTRWNHENGGSDKAMNAKQVSHLLGGNVFDLCPPPPPPEQHIDRVGDNAVRINGIVWMCKNISAQEDRENGIYVNPDNGETYFTWKAAVREAEKYPGWRLPTMKEYVSLINFCGGNNKAGMKLKSFKGWKNGGNGIDEYGFCAIPAGEVFRHNFEDVGEQAFFWSSTSNNSTAYALTLSDNDYAAAYNYSADKALSLRLIKADNDNQTPEIPEPSREQQTRPEPPSLRQIRPEPPSFRQSRPEPPRQQQTITEPHIEILGDNEVRINDITWSRKNISANEDPEHGIYVNPSNGETYFTWEAAVREAQKYPGWRLPTEQECTELAEACRRDGIKLKTSDGWKDDKNGSDEYGFSAKPAGIVYNGNFVDVGKTAVFWTSTAYTTTSAAFTISHTNHITCYNTDKRKACSLRLIKE